MSSESTPAGEAGICLSGGGLRAASFSLGVLQVLQQERRLVYGEDSARWLSAVSGGSYIAASHVLGGRRRSADVGSYAQAAPLADGSPEEKHILTHGRYLLDAPWQWPWLWALTFGALVALVAWAGFILADWAALTSLLPDGFEDDVNQVPGGLAAGSVWVGFTLAVAGLYSESWARRAVLGIVGIGLLYLTSRNALTWAAGLNVFDSRHDRVVAVAALVGALAVLGAVTFVVQKLRLTGLAGSILNVGAVVLTRLVGVAAIASIAIEWLPDMTRLVQNDASAATTPIAIGIVASLGLPLVFSPLAARASLHREYRGRLESCFGVVRGADAKAERVSGADLSEEPPPEGDLRFPRLLVCATANVRRRDPDGRRWLFRPFVLSHDTCAIPGAQEASFQTRQLELGRVPSDVIHWRNEPLISLFTAVAATGAAVSPSMGRFTVPSVRPLIAAMNFRLGRWIPNPYRDDARRLVASRMTPGKYKYPIRLGTGYDDLVPEMLGLSGRRVYLSDGGHYDNLGLVSLLRREPATVWCVDASPDPRGNAAELRRVLGLASEELRADIPLDCEVFRRGQDRLYGATHTTAPIAYESGATGTLVVLKLGLCDASPLPLKDARKRWGYPHHPTWRQIYPETRVRQYRDLGRDTAQRALDDGAGTPSGTVPSRAEVT